MKSIKRSPLRLTCGKLFYCLKRQIDWNYSRKKWVRTREASQDLPVMIFYHETPLIRNLPKVDHWLQLNKVKNLEIAIRKLNQLIIYPDEVFSFWLLLGKPTRAKGYVDGFVLNGGKIEPGIGGGLCQLSNLIYWMTLHTPLTVVERWRHSHDVFPDQNRTVPFGGGATCSYPSLDLQIHNPTKQPVQLCLKLSGGFLTGEWRSTNPYDNTYQVYEAFHEIIPDLWGRYIRHNILRRKVYNTEKKLVGDEFITENQGIMMYPPFLKETPHCPAV